MKYFARNIGQKIIDLNYDAFDKYDDVFIQTKEGKYKKIEKDTLKNPEDSNEKYLIMNESFRKVDLTSDLGKSIYYYGGGVLYEDVVTPKEWTQLQIN